MCRRSKRTHVRSWLRAVKVEAVSKLLDNFDLAETLGKAGRERVVRDFRPQDVWEALYQEYMKVLEQTNKKPKDNSDGTGKRERTT